MKTNTKKFMALLGGFCLLSLAACGGTKDIDNGDTVSLNCKYTFVDGTNSNIEDSFVVGEDGENAWISELILGSQSGAIFTGTVGSELLFSGMYNSNNMQNVPNIIMTEVLGINDPQKGDKVFIDGFGDGYIVEEIIDEEGYKSYLVDFNDPKFYSDAEYEIQILGVEKRKK